MLRRALPRNLSKERRAVVERALSLAGKVNYFWGGKSLVFGWDDRWGQLAKELVEPAFWKIEGRSPMLEKAN